MNVLIMGEGHVAESICQGLKSEKFKLFRLFDYNKVNKSKDYELVNDIENVENIDLIILAGYKPIISKDLIDKYKILNIHGSLLPKYRGMHSTVWAMLNGEEYVGYTIHELDELVDNGDIVYQYKTKVDEKTSKEIMDEFDEDLILNISNIVTSYLNGNINTKKQNFEEATFVARRNKKDCEINWNWDIEYMGRVMKALVDPYPLPYFEYKGKEYEIIKADLVNKNYEEIPGHVLYRDRQSVWIKMKDGLLRVYKLRVNGEEVEAIDILKIPGYRLGN